MMRGVFRPKKFLMGMAAGLCMLAAACVVVERKLRRPDHVAEQTKEAVEFRRVLLEQIGKADRIVVAEFGNPMDAGGKSGPAVDYRTVVLDAGQVARLREVVAAVKPEPKLWFAACFIPHHAIRFEQGGRQIAEMEVCLKCAGLRLDVTPASEPVNLFGPVEGFLGELGFHGEGDGERERRAMEGAK